ncbi:MAG: hypothetical protein ACYTG0_38925 [Planctomycetota bacterium]
MAIVQWDSLELDCLERWSRELDVADQLDTPLARARDHQPPN